MMRLGQKDPNKDGVESTSYTPRMWYCWLDGPADLVATWDMQPSLEGQGQRQRQRIALQKVGNTGSFFGATEAQARPVVLNGYAKGARIVETLAADISTKIPPPKSRRRVRKWGEEGDEACWERAQKGQDPWLSSHRKMRSALGLVELVVSWGASCGHTQEELSWSGACALALTDLLEKADFSVELCLVTGMHSQYNPSDLSLVRVDLKQMGELIDVERLAGVAVYGPAYRIYGLNVFQLGPWPEGTAFNGHNHMCAVHDRRYHGYKVPLWGYRPNVITLEIPSVVGRSGAIQEAIRAIKDLTKIVNPDAKLEDTTP